MSRHVIQSRRAGALWSVWCSCGWVYRYQTKRPAAVYAMHTANESAKDANSLMRQTPRDYRGGGR